MSNPIEICFVKLARVDPRLEELKTAVRAWYVSHPYESSGYYDEVSGYYIVRLTSVDESPPEFAAILSEIVHAMRSSLDNLAWQAAKLTRPAPTTCTAFPIVKDCLEWKSKTVRNILKDIPSAFETVFETLQPYKRGDSYQTHPLWMLRELDNLDKHEIPPAFGLVAINPSVDIHGVPGTWSIYDQIIQPFTRAEPGAEIARFRLEEGIDTSKIQVQINPAEDVEFGDSRPALKDVRVFPNLRLIRDYIFTCVLLPCQKLFP
jgi:hypothetical protein